MARRPSKSPPRKAAAKPSKAKRRPGRPSRSGKADEAARQVPPGVRVIKRYGNRRLYDPQASRAVNMREVEEMVRRGDDVRVLDGDSGEDLTRRTLVQILLEQENALQLDILPVELLRVMIRARSRDAVSEVGDIVRQLTQGLFAQWAQAGKAAGEILRSLSASAPGEGNPLAELQRMQAQMAELAARLMGQR